MSQVVDPVTRQQLSSIRTTLEHESTLSFYTDGSLANAGTCDMSMGLGWVALSSSISELTFSASASLFPSSTRAELLALLSALLVVPRFCTVTVYTDSLVLIQGFHLLLADNFRGLGSLNKSHNYLLWLAVHLVIRVSQLNVTCLKVAAHSNNVHNDQADSLANSGRSSLVEFAFNSDCLAVNSAFPKWNSFVLDTPVRSFIANCTQARHFDQFLHLRRNTSLLSLTHLDMIHWPLTWALLSYSADSMMSPMAASSKKVFKVKCLLQELPTLERLKIRRPDLYNNHAWTCCDCSDSETFQHLWTCRSRRPIVSSIIQSSISLLKYHIEAELNQCLSSVQYLRLSSLSCWLLLDNSDSFTFLSLAQGLVPADLFSFLSSCNISSTKCADIILRSLDDLHDRLRTDIWLPRNEKVIAKERLLGINSKLKRGTGRRINPNNLVFPVANYPAPVLVPALCDSWQLWVSSACTYGNSWQDF